MNNLTREIITQLLQTEEAWDKKTRKLRHDWVVGNYHGIREAMFYDEIYFPHMFRVMRLLRALKIVPEWAFEECTLGYDKEITGWWTTDPDWADAVQWAVEYGDNATSRYMRRMWYEEWEWENPSAEEILALGITPSVVPDKVYADGTVQKSLF